VQVRVELPNEKGLVQGGLFAHIAIGARVGDGLLAPASAIIRTRRARYIAFRVESATVTPVEVKISECGSTATIHVVQAWTRGTTVAKSANFLMIQKDTDCANGGRQMPGMAGM